MQTKSFRSNCLIEILFHGFRNRCSHKPLRASSRLELIYDNSEITRHINKRDNYHKSKKKMFLYVLPKKITINYATFAIYKSKSLIVRSRNLWKCKSKWFVSFFILTVFYIFNPKNPECPSFWFTICRYATGCGIPRFHIDPLCSTTSPGNLATNHHPLLWEHIE